MQRTTTCVSFGIVWGSLCFCGDSEHIPNADEFYPATPMDEVACYTSTSLPWLVATAATILALNAVCSFAVLAVTSPSLPPAIRLIISAGVACVFGANSNSEEEGEKKDESEDDGDTGTKALNA